MTVELFEIIAVLLILPFIMSLALTGLVKRVAHKANLLDIPNERSAHKTPTPRGGGMGFVVVTIIYLVAVGLFLDAQHLLIFAGAASLIGLVGWLDDKYSVSPLIRLIVHFSCATLVLAPFYSVGLPLWVWVISGFAIVGLINFYNFMDGIDGLAGVEAITAALTMGVIAISTGDNYSKILCLVLIAVVAGFLVFNWPPARIFMGDIGSGFLGLAFAMLAVQGAYYGGLPVLTATAIALGVFVVDASFTLLDRARRGEKVWLAHSEHAYQHAARRWGHKRVTVSVAVINIGWLAPNAICAVTWQAHGWIFLLIAYVPLIVLSALLKRL